MATNYNNKNHLLFNGGIEVKSIKVDTGIINYEDAVKNINSKTQNTVLFNNFTRNMYADYKSPNDEKAMSAISIYRKSPGQTYYDFVCFLSEGVLSFYDYNIRNNIYYHYLAAIPVPVVDRSQENGIGMVYKMYEKKNPDGTERFYHAYWKSWSITNIQESDTIENTYEQYGYTWNLKLNIESENITQNTSVTSWDTLGRFPKISIGKKNYNSGTFTGLLGDVAQYKKVDEYRDVNEEVFNETKEVFSYTERFIYQIKNQETGLNEDINTLTGQIATFEEIKYANEMQKLQKWREFINDGSLKLIKDLKGNAWIVQVQENPTYDIDNKPHSAPTTISFTWQEVENIDNTAIINME